MHEYTMLDKCWKVKEEFESTFFVSPKEILMTKEDRDVLIEETWFLMDRSIKGADEEVFGMKIVIVERYGPQARIGR